jgi:hypothetical protein
LAAYKDDADNFGLLSADEEQLLEKMIATHIGVCR